MCSDEGFNGLRFCLCPRVGGILNKAGRPSAEFLMVQGSRTTKGSKVSPPWKDVFTWKFNILNSNRLFSDLNDLV